MIGIDYCKFAKRIEKIKPVPLEILSGVKCRISLERGFDTDANTMRSRVGEMHEPQRIEIHFLTLYINTALFCFHRSTNGCQPNSCKID